MKSVSSSKCVPAAGSSFTSRRFTRCSIGSRERGWLKGRWIEKPGQRRRRFYTLTAEGRGVLEQQRHTWQKFVRAIAAITEVKHA
jgi:hypothetical protein